MARKSASAMVGGPLERHARASLAAAGRSLAEVARSCPRAVADVAEVMITSLEGGGTIYFCGNGGSAADAQHLAAELSGRYFLERPSLAAVALTTNTSALSAIGNDYGFDVVYSRQLESLGSPGDVLLAITTSGGSPNILKAVHAAHQLGMIVVGMTGEKGVRFARLCDHVLMTPSSVTPRIQEGHIAMGHTVCELIEHAMFGALAKARRQAPAVRRRKAGR